MVPARNAEATLARALDCLLDQELGDWDAIIVDDASTDRTPAIITDYVDRDARFRTLRSCAHRAAGALDLSDDAPLCLLG
ncbi:glycosyltransferase, partial [Mesorhizobium sp. M2E.F.Ca.ET.154.01.1.1]|uniref:glycosyltransferase family 2 protein n=1 Tax=Mesorhizobium sp. M2E.F.Ca.ET.154.01.1.1 TaxID=2500521 RepID=UPI001FEFB4F2